MIDLLLVILNTLACTVAVAVWFEVGAGGLVSRKFALYTAALLALMTIAPASRLLS